jgi:hypothetical protein
VTTSYSLWEQGRNLGSGQIVSMTPIEASRAAFGQSLGLITPGAEALSALAQFGIYYELHKMNELMEAQFEERRHGWVDAIIHQWIEEHRDTFGIQRRVTDALAVEVAKMSEKLADTSKMDVPQVLLLKLDRLTDFMEHHYRLQASAFNALVKISGSSDSWSYDLNVDLRESAMASIRAEKDQSATLRWQGATKAAIGVPLLFIPFLGTWVGGGSIGWGVTEAYTEHRKVERLKKLEEFPELLRFAVVYTYLTSASNALCSFLAMQGWHRKASLLVCERKNRKIDLILAPLRKARDGRGALLSLKPIEQARPE